MKCERIHEYEMKLQVPGPLSKSQIITETLIHKWNDYNYK